MTSQDLSKEIESVRRQVGGGVTSEIEKLISGEGRLGRFRWGGGEGGHGCEKSPLCDLRAIVGGDGFKHKVKPVKYAL